jgi:hypothetical protein
MGGLAWNLLGTECLDKKMAAQESGHFDPALRGLLISLLATRDSRHTATFRSASSLMYQ